MLEAFFENNKIHVNIQTQPDQQTPFWIELYRQTRLLTEISNPGNKKSFELDPQGYYGVCVEG